MIWLGPAALCSIAIALILKVNEGRGGNRILIAGANYVVASAISFVLVVAEASGAGASAGGLGGVESPGGGALALGAIAAANGSVISLGGIAWPDSVTLTLGVAAGVVYVLGFLLLMAGIARLPLAVPVTVARVSVVLPIALSILLWAEKPGFFQWLGIALGLVAIVLFGVSLTSSGHVSRADGRSGLLVACLFVVLGLGDVMLKAFRETAPDAAKLTFTFVLFSVASVFTWLILFVRRIRFDARTFTLGLLLGVPNLFSTVCTLLALRNVPASIAFPFINLTVIAGSTLLGFAIWRERLRAMSVAGLLVAVAAIIFLSFR